MKKNKITLPKGYPELYLKLPSAYNSSHSVEWSLDVDFCVKHNVHIMNPMLDFVKDFFINNNIDFDEFNGLAPTRKNKFLAYGYAEVWVWTAMVLFLNGKDKYYSDTFDDKFFKKFGKTIGEVYKKYPEYTSCIQMEIDLRFTDNKFYDCIVDVDPDFAEKKKGVIGDNANKFKEWLMDWSSRSNDKDKMRVNNWIHTNKSHKQIISEINRVAANPHKFNARMACFIEILFNKEGLDDFYSKPGFKSKTDMLMAYFDKITDLDDDTKRKFIETYLV